MAPENNQYGTYHGELLKDPDYPKTCSEQELYLYINTFGGLIWRTNHSINNGIIEISQSIQRMLNQAQYAIEFCVLQSRRFGVEIPEPKDGGHVERTSSYDAWYRWWDSYFQKELTPIEWNEFQTLLASKKDVSDFRPKGDWRENVSE